MMAESVDTGSISKEPLRTYKIWFSEPDEEPKIGLEPRSTKLVSRYIPTLIIRLKFPDLAPAIVGEEVL